MKMRSFTSAVEYNGQQTIYAVNGVMNGVQETQAVQYQQVQLPQNVVQNVPNNLIPVCKYYMP